MGSVRSGFTSHVIRVIYDTLPAGSLAPISHAQIILGLSVIFLLYHGLHLSPTLFIPSEEKHVAASHHHHYELKQTATSTILHNHIPDQWPAVSLNDLDLLNLLAQFEQGIVLDEHQASLLIYFSGTRATSTVIVFLPVACLSGAFMYFTD